MLRSARRRRDQERPGRRAFPANTRRLPGLAVEQLHEVVAVKYVVMVVAVVMAVIVAACGGGSQPAGQQPGPSTPAAPGPAAGTQVVVRLSEFKFELTPAEVPAGTVTFDVQNVGTVEHDFMIVELDRHSELVRPGQRTTLTVDLPPGTYTVICEVAGHKEAGMQLQLVVK